MLVGSYIVDMQSIDQPVAVAALLFRSRTEPEPVAMQLVDPEYQDLQD